MNTRTVIPGWRYFSCEECGHEWREACRDYATPSGSACQNCGEFESPVASEPKPEWPTEFGNLRLDVDYEEFDKKKGALNEKA